MRRKKLPPKPEPPPEGYMFWCNRLVTVSYFETFARGFYDQIRDKMPDWRDDPTYNMKINKRRKQNAV